VASSTLTCRNQQSLLCQLPGWNPQVGTGTAARYDACEDGWMQASYCRSERRSAAEKLLLCTARAINPHRASVSHQGWSPSQSIIRWEPLRDPGAGQDLSQVGSTTHSLSLSNAPSHELIQSKTKKKPHILNVERLKEKLCGFFFGCFFLAKGHSAFRNEKRPTAFDKKVLLWTGRFRKEEDIPPLLS
ncbi:hypothetical protein lerEdw1_003064, partial [Lerista edwardsae]